MQPTVDDIIPRDWIWTVWKTLLKSEPGSKSLTTNIFHGSCYIVLWLRVSWPEITFYEIADCPAFLFLPWVPALTSLNSGRWPGSTRWNKFFPTHIAFDQSVVLQPPRKGTAIVTLLPSVWYQLCRSWLVCYDTQMSLLCLWPICIQGNTAELLKGRTGQSEWSLNPGSNTGSFPLSSTHPKN